LIVIIGLIQFYTGLQEKRDQGMQTLLPAVTHPGQRTSSKS